MRLQTTALRVRTTMALLLFILHMLTPRAAHGQVCQPYAPCGQGQLCDPAGACRAVDAVLQDGGGRVFWVDGARGDDRAPGTGLQPWATAARSTQPGVLSPGDAVVFRAGVYHEPLLPTEAGAPGRPIRFVGYPGETVVFSGATPLEGAWMRDGADWVLDWPYPPLWTKRIHDGVPHDDDARRRDLLILNGEVLHPVYQRADLQDQRFFLEGSPDVPIRMFVRLPAGVDANNQRWETSRIPHLFRSATSEISCLSGPQLGFLHLAGLTFEHVANEGQQGGVCLGGEGSLLTDVTVRWTNGAGVLVGGKNQVLQRVTALHNGMSGIRGERCVACLVEDSRSHFNNWKGYLPFWESGGGKWQYTTQSVFRRLDFSENAGPGLWLDIHNTDNIVENSRFQGNYGVNLFIEYQSNRNLVRNNVMTGARYARPSFFGYGMLIHASDDNQVLHNTFLANEGGGLRIRADDRGRALGNRYYNNLFAANLAFQGLTGRDLSFENHRTLADARTNRGGGNVFWKRTSATADYQSFYLRLLGASGAAILRTADLAAWQERLNTDHTSFELDPTGPHGLDSTDTASGWRMTAGSALRGLAPALPDALAHAGRDIDDDVRPPVGADPGADQFTEPILAGDLSADGRLSAYDAALVLLLLQGKAPGNVAAGHDTNRDGRVDIADAIAILKRVASGISVAP